MRNRARWIGVCIGLAFSLGVTGAGKPLANAADWPRNVARVKTGIFEYRDSNHGKNVGSSTMTIQRLAGSGNLSFINRADLLGELLRLSEPAMGSGYISGVPADSR